MVSLKTYHYTAVIRPLSSYEHTLTEEKSQHNLELIRFQEDLIGPRLHRRHNILRYFERLLKKRCADNDYELGGE